MDQRNPVDVGWAFLTALGHREQVPLIELFVTPESLLEWGDFSDAASRYLAIPSAGISRMAHRASMASDVAYLYVFPNYEEQAQMVGETVSIPPDTLATAYAVTLVWRPECGMWLVHAFGDRPLNPVDVPRTSFDFAPSLS